MGGYRGGRSALYGGAPVGRFMGCALSFPFFRTPKVVKAQPFWGLLGLLGALALLAYWGALKVFNYSLLSTHYSLIESFPL